MMKLAPIERYILETVAAHKGTPTAEQIQAAMSHVDHDTWVEWLPPILDRLTNCGYLKTHRDSTYYLP